ncbi:glycerate kinase [Cohnella sp. AR92]|uniref:glycerate kinase n=1 Tax=Cohnella sp. AR92 TaxID=648716 RepID=UPI000F8F35E6|nr:glycerate kinase [Cohnella sp. AR92]RUS47815.1 glycerate kinase [Cohnella sp. AR92]
MPRFVVVPDSFKGSLTSLQAGHIISDSIRKHFPDAEIDVIPVADGGEGTVEALVTAASGKLIDTKAAGPLGDETDTQFGIIGGDTAVFELANVAGLPMVPKEKRNPYDTTTRGLGELIKQALDKGLRRLVVGLGGSATNDGGMGMLSELGVRFRDADGDLLPGYGRDVGQAVSVDFGGLDPRLAECELIAACDVKNPLCGPEGASVIFGPQKGATPEQAAELDRALLGYAGLVERELGRPALHEVPGAGAAGGLGFALLSLGFTLAPGAELIDRMAGLESRIAGSDWVITGEGRTDGQSAYGKLPYYAATLAKKHGAKAILISGSLGADYLELRELFAGCFALITEPSDLQTCMDRAVPALAACSDNVMGFLRIARSPW